MGQRRKQGEDLHYSQDRITDWLAKAVESKPYRKCENVEHTDTSKDDGGPESESIGCHLQVWCCWPNAAITNKQGLRTSQMRVQYQNMPKPRRPAPANLVNGEVIGLFL